MKRLGVSNIYADCPDLPATETQWFIKTLARLNIPLNSLLQNTNLDEQWLNNPHAMVTPSAVLNIISNALAESVDESLGLTIGMQTRLCDYGILGYAVISSRTLGEAADIVLHFWDLSGSLINLTRKQDESNEIWEIRPAFLIEDMRLWRFLVEEFLAAIHASIYFLTNRIIPFHQIVLSYPRPSYYDKYHNMFDCPTYFNRKLDAIYLPNSNMEIPTSMGHPQVLETCIRQCENIRAKLGKKDALIEAIQNLVTSSSCRIIRLEQVSENLAMSSRTLQRKLRKRNTSFQAILDETRKELAKSYLQDTSLTVDQISDRIGFSESVSFRQAFKKWTGMPPTAFRRLTQSAS